MGVLRNPNANLCGIFYGIYASRKFVRPSTRTTFIFFPLNPAKSAANIGIIGFLKHPSFSPEPFGRKQAPRFSGGSRTLDFMEKQKTEALK
jgi:hypothetical protein